MERIGTVKEHLIEGFTKKELYTDQAGWVKGVFIGSCYFELGIRRMETLFSNRIRAFGAGKSFTLLSWRGDVDGVFTDTEKELKREIKKNPHLHPVIKKNLLLNLRNYAKQRAEIN